MSPTEQQIALVKATFRKIVPISERMTRTFYDRVFELAPETRTMFKTDIKEQGRKFIQMLAVLVGGLERMPEIVPGLNAMGKRHIGYGVAKAHYPVIGNALLWAIKDTLGTDFTPEVEAAWRAVYDMMAENAMHAYA
jgi:hemoglobin-like flavoprotein